MKINLSTTAAAALCLFSTTAFGLTAEEVWEKYEVMLRTEADTPVTVASRSKVGDTLSITGLSVKSVTDDFDISYTIDSIRLTEQSDGSVSVETAETIPFNLTVKEDGGPVSLQFEYTQKDAVLTVSGTVDQMNFDSKIAQASVTLGEMQGVKNFSDADVVVTLRDLAMSSNVDADGLQVGSFRSAALAMDFSIQDPNSDDGFDGTMIANNLAGTFKGNIDAFANLGTGKGPTPDLHFSYGFDDSSGQMNIDIEGEDMKMLFSAGTSNVVYDINSEKIRGESVLGGMSLTYNIPMMPLPVEVSMGDVGGAVEFPTGKNKRGPVEYGFYMRDVVIGDGLWALFDRNGVLPRDPITLELKLKGDAELGFDLLSMDPEELETIEDPGKIYGLNLESLVLRAVGAELTGNGAFTFDNDDLKTLDGFPRPMGKALFNLVGANALLDALPQTGLIKAEDLLPVRMMMGMFTQPGDGEDSLKTEVEVNEQFHVLVNGVRMQ